MLKLSRGWKGFVILEIRKANFCPLSPAFQILSVYIQRYTMPENICGKNYYSLTGFKI